MVVASAEDQRSLSLINSRAFAAVAARAASISVRLQPVLLCVPGTAPDQVLSAADRLAKACNVPVDAVRLVVVPSENLQQAGHVAAAGSTWLPRLPLHLLPAWAKPLRGAAAEQEIEGSAASAPVLAQAQSGMAEVQGVRELVDSLTALLDDKARAELGPTAPAAATVPGAQAQGAVRSRL
uniref:Uncharacterized protein n=1 Tax=Chlamydomonas leiostraca TaxID=1034604 RepID=A0A7S0RBU6_9CHLO|mmetsp:Transcript_18531/g.46942  ORF Transcript_18531/g.46942 Transcript_18531/m.46942 type:complete len:181 (+) Transcript_18531:261-803(+)